MFIFNNHLVILCWMFLEIIDLIVIMVDIYV